MYTIVLLYIPIQTIHMCGSIALASTAARWIVYIIEDNLDRYKSEHKHKFTSFFYTKLVHSVTKHPAAVYSHDKLDSVR